MPLMPLTDSTYLIVETREHPMHVGGLQLFELPEGTGCDYLSGIYHRLVASPEVNPLFARKPTRSLRHLGQWSWARDVDIDLEYHLRFSALPRPGRVRELLELVSCLHGTLLDRHRPLWEMHLIEGLQGNRFAIYTKVHHSMLDGVSALRWMQSSLSTDPDEFGMPAPFNLPARPRAMSEMMTAPQPEVSMVDQVTRLLGDLAGFPGAVLDVARKGLRDPATKLPFQAPRSILNGCITGARRFAAQDWPMDRIKMVRGATGGTVNDVVLAMCSGALRRYLLELGALPERGLVAAVPVSLRQNESEQSAGNAIGFSLADLATDERDPHVRMGRIQQSMLRAKENFADRSPLQVLGLSLLNIGALGLSPIPGLADWLAPPFNVIISNVPGPQRTMYWNGARMRGVYPLSVVLDGQALNITVASYDGALQFGLTGCRRSVPHLQRMLTYLDESLAELE